MTDDCENGYILPVLSIIAGTVLIIIGLILTGDGQTTAGVITRIIGNIFNCLGIVWAITRIGVRR